VPPLVEYLVFLLRELLRVPFDLITGIKRRDYVLSIDVSAPKEISWAVASAHKIKLEGTPPVELDTAPDPLRPGVYSGVCRFGERVLPFAYQVIDERPGEAMTLRLLADECDPVYRLGEDYMTAIAITGDSQRSTIVNTFGITHTKFLSRLILPLTLLRGALSLKRTAETWAGNASRTTGDQIKSALITGALTFASFFALFGGSIAAGLLIVILLHELGHVIAMRWAGIPVRGIYFVPFFGGVAVGDSLGTSQIARGFVALMGPAFSIVTTLALVVLSTQSSEPLLFELALLSALLNGFNLLPILPLDGGRVLQAMTSRIAPGAARTIHALLLCIGIGMALWLGDYLLMAVMILIAPAVLRVPASATEKLAPLRNGEFAWLSLGYLATLAFYVAVAARLWSQTPILSD